MSTLSLDPPAAKDTHEFRLSIAHVAAAQWGSVAAKVETQHCQYTTTQGDQRRQNTAISSTILATPKSSPPNTKQKRFYPTTVRRVVHSPDGRETDGDEAHAQELYAGPHQHAEQHGILGRRPENVRVDQLLPRPNRRKKKTTRQNAPRQRAARLGAAEEIGDQRNDR